MELDDSVRQSTNDLSFPIRPWPTLSYQSHTHTHTQKCDVARGGDIAAITMCMLDITSSGDGMWVHKFKYNFCGVIVNDVFNGMAEA